MALPEREPERMQAALEAERSGAVLKTIGGVLLAMDFILVVFVWVGHRTGSNFWLYWVLIQGFLGLLLIRVGITKQRRADRAPR